MNKTSAVIDATKAPNPAATPAAGPAAKPEAQIRPQPTRWASIWDKARPDTDRPIIFVNGHMVPKTHAMVSVYDHGLLYGDGVFEGIRVYKRKIFKCQQHVERLYKCAERIHLKIPIPMADMVQIQRDCIEANDLNDGYIRLVVSRGYGTLGLDPRRCPVPGIICIADQIRLYPEEAYEKGMRVVVARRPKTPVACLDPRIKSLNYLNNILAKVEAIEQGCDEAIMLSTDGWVTECTGDNLFIVKNGTVITPPHTTGNSGSLEGVTRRFVFSELTRICGVPAREQEMRLDDVLAADEVFLTGTAAEMIAVTAIDAHDGKRHTIGKGGEGPITRKLRQQFRAIVTSDHIPED